MPACPRRRRAAAVVLALLISFVVATTRPAVAEELHHVTGMVSGTEVQIHRASVEIYRLMDGEWDWYDDRRSSTRALDLALPDGTYRLLVSEYLGVYYPLHTPEWYDGGSTWDEATDVVVNGSDVVLRPIQLAERVPLRGTAVTPDGAPAANLLVTLTSARNDTDLAFLRTGADGIFEMVVDPGDWKLRFSDSRDDYLVEWYRDQPTHELATSITVGSEAVELAPVTVSTGGTLAGTVLTAAGAPVAGAKVTVVDSSDLAVDWLRTDAGGGFAASELPSDDYRIYVEHADFAPRFHGGASLATATPVPVDADGRVTVPDIRLTPRTSADPLVDAQLTGTVRAPDGTPLSGVEVTASGVGRHVGGLTEWTTTDAAGRYTFRHLSDEWSTWELALSEGTEDAGRPDVVSSGRGTAQGASGAVSVAPVGATVVDPVARLYGGLRGTVTAAAGTDLRAIQVMLYDEAGEYVTSVYGRDLVGHEYHFRRLDPGRYFVRFLGEGVTTEEGAEIMPVWWPSARTMGEAVAVDVTEGTFTDDISATLTSTPDPPPVEPEPEPEPEPQPEPTKLALTATPQILGKAVMGERLIVEPGSWSLTDVAEKVEWLVGGRVVASGISLLVTPRLAGAVVRPRLTGTHRASGQQVAVDLDPIVLPATASAVRARARLTGSMLTLLVTLVDPTYGSSRGDGPVTVWERGRRLLTAPLNHRKARTKVALGRVRPGRHVYTVRFAGSAALRPSETKVVVRVPKRPAGHAAG